MTSIKEETKAPPTKKGGSTGACDQKKWTASERVLGQGSSGIVVQGCRDGGGEECAFAIKVVVEKPERFHHELWLSTVASDMGIGPRVLDAWSCPSVDVAMEHVTSVPLLRFLTRRRKSTLPVHFLVMEQLTGDAVSFHDWMKRSHTEAQYQALVADARDAMAMLHAAGLTHGDVTAENIWVRANQRVVFIDFGEAAFHEHHVQDAADKRRFEALLDPRLYKTTPTATRPLTWTSSHSVTWTWHRIQSTRPEDDLLSLTFVTPTRAVALFRRTTSRHRQGAIMDAILGQCPSLEEVHLGGAPRGCTPLDPR